MEEEKTEEKVEEKKKPSKGPLGCLLILIAIVAAGFFGWKYLTTASTKISLGIDAGQVQVNGKEVKSGTSVKEGDTVKTGDGAEATVSFPEGTEIRLDENTEIKINSSGEKISIFQEVGRTWSRVVNILGYVEYKVESKNVVASVRGTAFVTEVGDEQTDIDVDDGSVATSNETGNSVVEIGRGITVNRTSNRIVNRAIRADLRNSEWYKKNQQKDIELLERIRKRSTSIRSIVSGFSAISPSDLAKLRGLAARAQSGAFNISESQANALENLDYTSPAGIAQALNIVDPQEFSDTAHWTRVIRSLFPFIQRFGVERVFQEQ